jgi:hypothetical protein
MKPLLVWRTPTDANFRDKLVRRLRSTVLRDWAKQQAVDDKIAAEIQKFQALSVARRLAVLRGRSMQALGRRGFKTWSFFGFSGEPSANIESMARQRYPVISEIRRGRKIRLAVVAASESFTISTLRGIDKELHRLRFQYGLAKTASAEVRCDVLLISLDPLPVRRLERVFDSYGRFQAGQLELTIPSVIGGAPSPVITTRLYSFGPIASEEAFTTILRQARV